MNLYKFFLPILLVFSLKISSIENFSFEDLGKAEEQINSVAKELGIPEYIKLKYGDSFKCNYVNSNNLVMVVQPDTYAPIVTKEILGQLGYVINGDNWKPNFRALKLISTGLSLAACFGTGYLISRIINKSKLFLYRFLRNTFIFNRNS